MRVNRKGDNRMGNLFRRVLAFVLGMVFTLTAAASALVGGAYWAYKNVKPIGMVDDSKKWGGDLPNQTIEDLVVLLKSALADPSQYTFARLQSEYGQDLEPML